MAANTSSMLSLYDDISADDRAEGGDATALRPKPPSSTNATPQITKSSPNHSNNHSVVLSSGINSSRTRPVAE